MNSHSQTWRTLLLALAASPSLLHAQYKLDLTHPRTVLGANLGMGTTANPKGHRIWADSQCLYQDKTPWLPAAGEFQFSRYPREDWREELLKMKADGIDVIGTYVFWNHIEEDRGVYNWTGQRSLREFLKECQEVGLKAFVRMGPWVHGESRNGGFPDWLIAASKEKHFRLRTTDKGYLDCVRPYYQSMATQMKGLLWKDGGPVIGIQVDNECHDLAYLQELKQMAIRDGVDVPLYTMTGWAVPVPESGLIPMFGRYGDAFWVAEGDPETNKSYLINDIRDDGDMGIIGGQVGTTNVNRADQLARYPHMCIETGGGMQSTYDRRIWMKPDDTGSLALCRLASGANFLGYYIFHGGITPDGRHSSLNESTASGYPFNIPLKDYDFNAPISNCGVLRDSYHLLREQHLFLQAFGANLAAMKGFYPTQQPTSITDTSTLRWSVRSDGAHGFLFFNNFQQSSTLPAKEGVQFLLKTVNGTIQVPSSPVMIPSDSYGVWPLNMDCGGVTLRYSTAQPITHLADGQEWYFFKALDGIKPEFSIETPAGPKLITGIRPGTGQAFSARGKRGQVHFVVLTAEQASRFWKFGGRAVLCKDALLPVTSNELIGESIGSTLSKVETFPRITNAKHIRSDGVFEVLNLPTPMARAQVIQPWRQSAAMPDFTIKSDAMSEDSWRQAAIWEVPSIAGDKLLRIRYIGDVARVYAGGKLIADNFYNGAPFDIGLWRIPAHLRNTIQIRVMPLFKKDRGRLPSRVRAGLDQAPVIAKLVDVQVLDRVRTDIKIGRER